MKIENTGFTDRHKKNPDLQSPEFLEEVKKEFKDFGDWLDKKADDDGIASYSLVLYKDLYDHSNRGVQIAIRDCSPEDVIDVVVQAISHLVFDVAENEKQKLYILDAFKRAASAIEKHILEDVGTGNLFKD